MTWRSHILVAALICVAQPASAQTIEQENSAIVQAIVRRIAQDYAVPVGNVLIDTSASGQTPQLQLRPRTLSVPTMRNASISVGAKLASERETRDCLGLGRERDGRSNECAHDVPRAALIISGPTIEQGRSALVHLRFFVLLEMNASTIAALARVELEKQNGDWHIALFQVETVGSRYDAPPSRP